MELVTFLRWTSGRYLVKMKYVSGSVTCRVWSSLLWCHQNFWINMATLKWSFVYDTSCNLLCLYYVMLVLFVKIEDCNMLWAACNLSLCYESLPLLNTVLYFLLFILSQSIYAKLACKEGLFCTSLLYPSSW